MIKQIAISYNIYEIPRDKISGFNFEIKPVVYLHEGVKKEPLSIMSPMAITMQKEPKNIDDIFKEKNEYFKKIGIAYRAHQERVISDIICGIILEKLRIEKDSKDKLIFFITSKFNTEKIVGRLGYLSLPTDRITILFISRNINDFYTRNIVSPFDSIFDIIYLNKKDSINKIFGPYPDDGTIGLLRTFYKTYDYEAFPLRIDLFCQGLNNVKISQIKDEINNIYLSEKNTEPEKVLGLKEKNLTFVPKILCECEKYAEKMEDDKKW